MAISKFLLFSFYVISLAFLLSGVQASNAGKRDGGVVGYKKLFVFGDSYVDTGNLGKVGTRSWYFPYGITYPKKPTGRFSDGRVFTDFLADFLGIKSPVPYKFRRAGRSLLRNGMNFAAGGAGYLDTHYHVSNLSTQITEFEEQVEQGAFPKSGLADSLALVFMSGNDYSDFSAQGGNLSTVVPFTEKLLVNLKEGILRLRDIGVPKVLVSDMQPFGCTPNIAQTENYTDCGDLGMIAAGDFNYYFGKLMSKLDNTTFGVLNVFNPIHNIVNAVQPRGHKVFKHRFRPCCDRFYSDGYCGQIDKNGTYLFRLCENPEDHFYWDNVHPTQSGWAAVFGHVKDQIRGFLSH